MTTDRCPFEKAILCSCCRCPLAEKHLLAERESVSCSSQARASACLEFYEALKSMAFFALKLTEGRIPHAKEMKLECGGLNGLRATLGIEDPDVGVSELLSGALSRFRSPENFPPAEFVQSISAYSPRRRD